MIEFLISELELISELINKEIFILTQDLQNYSNNRLYPKDKYKKELKELCDLRDKINGNIIND